MDRFKVMEADYHRNGVGGAGFYVGIVCDRVEDRRMLITWFPEYDEDGDVLVRHQRYVAVVDLDQVAQGNVYMHPTSDRPGNNAWRGADHYADAARAIKTAVDERYAERLAEIETRAASRVES